MERPILIQGAMHSEISLLLERLGSVEETTHEGFPFWSGVWEKIPVVVSKTYAGKINAALATATGIRKFSPALVLNQGTAGAHRPDLEVGRRRQSGGERENREECVFHALLSPSSRNRSRR